MLMAVLIYLVVGLYMKDKIGVVMEKDVFEKLRIALYMVSFATLIATKFIRKYILSRKGHVQTAQHPVLAKYTLAMIVSLAMSESIAIYGLLLFLMGKKQLDLYLLTFIAVAAMLYYRPKKEEIIEIIEEERRHVKV